MGDAYDCFKDGYAFHMDMVEREENRKIVESAIEKVFHQNLRVKCDFEYNLQTASDEPENEKDDEETVKEYFKDHEDKLKIIDQ